MMTDPTAPRPQIGSLCTGYGGLDMAVQQVFGGTVAWVADPDPGAAAILAHHHPGVPNLGDITTTCWQDVPRVDIVCGGYPCQPFSDAGRRKGTADERHIWPYIAAALRVLRPRVAVFENVSGHLRRGFDTVLSDLAGLGFDAEWCLVRASQVGAPHRRERLFVLAWSADTDRPRLEGAWLRRAASERALAAAHAPSDGRDKGRAEPTWQLGGSDVALCGPHAPTDTDRDRREVVERIEPSMGSRDDAHRRSPIGWGRFAPAIGRWEHVTGRRAPGATEPGRTGDRLSPVFVEWLMGLPAGWVTAVPGLSRNAQLKALGNGVVPQQGAAALDLLLTRTRYASVLVEEVA